MVNAFLFVIRVMVENLYSKNKIYKWLPIIYSLLFLDELASEVLDGMVMIFSKFYTFVGRIEIKQAWKKR